MQGVSDGVTHIDLCSQVKDDLGAVLLDERVEVHLQQVRLDHGQAAAALRLLQVLQTAVGEIVHHDNLVPLGEEQIDQVRADETGAAGDESVHVPTLTS